MEKVAVVGAGLIGSLQAIYLARKGFEVHVYERRGDMRGREMIGGRSINLALSDRGWKALEGVGIADAIRQISIPMRARKIHNADGHISEQPYGKDGQAIYSVSRGGLNQRLMHLADDYANVHYYFDHRCDDIDLDSGTLHFTHTPTNTAVQAQYGRIFGTDGAYSAVRARLQRTDRFSYAQTYLEHGYKELCIPANPDGTHKLEKEYLHIWPRGQFMMIALPNQDGSFTCTLFFPFDGPESFNSLDTPDKVLAFFTKTFADAVPLMPTLLDDYMNNPTSSLMMVQCSPWNYHDKVLLMGDASHAIVPFYGQGMNSGFEDCTEFNRMFDEMGGDFSAVFGAFDKVRKPNTDAIRELALRNYIEMRDLTADENFLLQKKIEARIHKKYPDKWIPLYTQVTFTHIPYAEALKAGMKQDEIMARIMARPDIHTNWESEEVEQEILALL
jgi:kynurenine 3-monooxygenase